jgi:arylsulfatase A-like enzyme
MKGEIQRSTFRAHKLPAVKRDSRPNILLLMTDQQRFDTIQATGSAFMETPGLDRLAREGRHYSHAYSPNPICLAARHNLLTGLPARYHGFPDNLHGATTRTDLPTLPRILSDNGYETRAIGKMHFLPPRRHNGFDRMELMEELPTYREQDDYAMYLKQVGLGHIQHIHGVRHLLYMVPQRSLIPEEHHGTKWLGDRAIEFLRSNRGRQPFFLWLSWIAPHPPFDVPDRLADLYRDARLPTPFRSKTPTSSLAEESKTLGDLPDERYVRRMRELYYAAITFVDEQICRVLDAMEEMGLLDNTLILFLSDHGELLGDYGLYQKWLPYDSCARIPFIVRYPDQIEPGSVYRNFVDLNDILPTALDVAGIAYPADYPLPGESLLSPTPQKDRTRQYMEYSFDNRRWVSICTRTHKYNYYYGNGYEELFDLVDDRHETTNLLASKANENVASIRASLRRQLIDIERTWGLKGYVDNGNFLVGPPYEPHPQRNQALPRFPAYIMDKAERTQMNDLFEEILAAVASEPVVRLRDLDVAAWQRNGGFSGEAVGQLLQRDDRRRGEGHGR